MLFFLLLSILQACVSLPLPRKILANDHVKRSETLAQGNVPVFGDANFTDIAAMPTLEWQASGILTEGGCPLEAVHIEQCFESFLTDDPDDMLETGSPFGNRQRNEFLTSGASDGETWEYEWKYYLTNETGTSIHFFHTMQLFSRADGGPIMTLDPVNDTVAVLDNVRDCSVTNCPSIPLSEYTGITTLHQMLVQFGPTGYVNYNISNLETGELLMSYNASGYMGRESVSLKFGLYRITESGQTLARAFMGDFAQTQLETVESGPTNPNEIPHFGHGTDPSTYGGYSSGVVSFTQATTTTEAVLSSTVSTTSEVSVTTTLAASVSSSGSATASETISTATTSIASVASTLNTSITTSTSAVSAPTSEIATSSPILSDIATTSPASTTESTIVATTTPATTTTSSSVTSSSTSTSGSALLEKITVPSSPAMIAVNVASY